MEDGLRLFFRRIPSSFAIAVLITSLLTFELSGQGAGVSCYQRINISINSGSSTRLNVSQLSPRPINPGDTVLLEDRTELRFTCEDVGQIITATLMDAGGEMCTVDIHVEDKSPLDITCRDTMINCMDNIMSIPLSSLIEVVSSCDDLTGAAISHIDDDPIPFPATSDILESIRRNYTVVSASGDTARCSSEILIERLDLNTIVFPGDITISCGSDPADTSITGGLEIDPELLSDLCNVAISTNIDERAKGSCQNPRVYEREWAITDWATDEIRRVTQLISVLDENIYQIMAPDTFEMITIGCQVGIVLDTAEISTICLEFGQSDVEILLDGGVHDVGDTVFVQPGTFSIVYQARAGCLNVLSDTVSVDVSDASITPLLLDCTSIGPKCVIIRDDMPLLVAIDTFCSGAIFESCGDAVLRARKVNTTCPSNTDVFQDILEFCPEDLPSGQTSGIIMIEVAAVLENTLISNVCTIEVEVKEDVAPIIDLVVDPTITLGDDGTFTLDTSVFIDGLFDESDCILSLAMTGSGTGFLNTMTTPTGSGTEFAGALALTGSGIPFFVDGDFFTLTCPDTGTYDVFIVAEDCSNNLALDTTSLTVLPGDACDVVTMPRTLSGSITSAYGDPFPNVNVNLTSSNRASSSVTSLDGTFHFRELSGVGEITIQHDDSWLTGVSVMDLRLLQNFIIGVLDLEDWQKAAADVDGSGSVTSKDLLIAKLILLDRDVPRRNDEMPWLFSLTSEVDTYYENLIAKIEPSEYIYISATKKGDINGDAIKSGENRSHESLPIDVHTIDERHTRYTIDATQDIFQISLDIRHGSLMTMSHLDQYMFGSETSLDIIKYDTDDKIGALSFVVQHQVGVKPSIAISDRLDPISYDQLGVRSSLGIMINSDQVDAKEEFFNISAYPNPSNGDVWIDLAKPFRDGSYVDITVTDMQGRLINQREWSEVEASDIFPYKLPDMPHAGMYIAQIRFNNRIETLHIIIN